MDVPNVPQAVIGMVVWGGAGYLYGQLARVSSTQTALILAISDMMDSLFYLIAQKNHSHSNRLAAHIVPSQVIQAITIIALRYFNLIGEFGLCLLTTASLFSYYGKIYDLRHQLLFVEGKTI